MVGHGSFDYTGESAIVTGSTKGIGCGIAESLAESGANVAINARTAADIDEAVTEMNADHEGDIIGVPGDVSDPADIETLVETAIEAFGTIDLLVNNAAMWPREESMIEASLDDWNQVLNVNVRSQFYTAKLVAEHMIERGIEGNILNVTSQNGERRWGGVSRSAVPSASSAAGASRVVPPSRPVYSVPHTPPRTRSGELRQSWASS